MTKISSEVIVWLSLAAALFVAVGGLFFGWYQQFTWYDSLAHAVAWFGLSLAAAWFLYGRVLTGAERAPVVLAITVTAIGLGAGAAWEIGEFLYDRLSGPRNVIQAKADTIADLGWDTLGSGVAGAAAVALLKGRGYGRAQKR